MTNVASRQRPSARTLAHRPPPRLPITPLWACPGTICDTNRWSSATAARRRRTTCVCPVDTCFAKCASRNSSIVGSGLVRRAGSALSHISRSTGDWDYRLLVLHVTCLFFRLAFGWEKSCGCNVTDFLTFWNILLLSRNIYTFRAITDRSTKLNVI